MKRSSVCLRRASRTPDPIPTLRISLRCLCQLLLVIFTLKTFKSFLTPDLTYLGTWWNANCANTILIVLLPLPNWDEGNNSYGYCRKIQGHKNPHIGQNVKTGWCSKTLKNYYQSNFPAAVGVSSHKNTYAPPNPLLWEARGEVARHAIKI